MKKLLALFSVLFLASCGAIGIGSNHETMIYNNSKNMITATSSSGIYKIKPENSMSIYSKEKIEIKSSNSACQQPIITSSPNGAAIFLDVIPGWLLGIVPLLVDAMTDNIYHMPETYYYTCD